MCLDGTTTGAPHHSHSRGFGRRAFLTGGAAAAAAVTTGGAAAVAAVTMPTPVAAARRAGLVDLSHPFTTSFPTFPAFEPPQRSSLATVVPNGFYAQQWTFAEHAGTHIDVPGHFKPDGRLLPEITLEELVRPAVRIDVSQRASNDPDTTVTLQDLHMFEREHGQIPKNAAVLMYSGWERRLQQGQAAYRGEDALGRLHFPGFSREAVFWLAQARGVRCIGTDTLSLDPGNSAAYEAHETMLSAADGIGLENVAHLDSIPPTGATIMIGAVAFEEGSGGPCRILATW